MQPLIAGNLDSRASARGITRAERRVIIAASLGTVLELYDFFVVGLLANELAKAFFSGINPTAAYIFTLVGFAAGFVLRPFGALAFGRIGDLFGRKRTFLVTIVMMGACTFGIGLIPGYASPRNGERANRLDHCRVPCGDGRAVCHLARSERDQTPWLATVGRFGRWVTVKLMAHAVKLACFICGALARFGGIGWLAAALTLTMYVGIFIALHGLVGVWGWPMLRGVRPRSMAFASASFPPIRTKSFCIVCADCAGSR